MNKQEKETLLAAAASLFASAGVFFCAAEKEKKKKQNKREWVKCWRLARNNKSSFRLLKDELLLVDKDAYRRYLRMNEDCFLKILNCVEGAIRRQNTQMRDAIAPEEGLTLVMRFLATGESYRSLDYQTRLSRSYISKFIPLCCAAIYEGLKAEYLKFPSSHADWETIANGYFNRWHFPLCLGALDGKHIAFRASKTDGSLYYNYKGFNSIVLLALCDAQYRFIMIDVGCNGRVSDGGVLHRSDFGTVLNNSEHYFPPDKIIGNNRKLPYCVIGDDAFPLQRQLLKPYPYSSQEMYKKVFNFRLSHARQCIEHSFGMLANKFRVFQTTLHLRPDKVKDVVQACCALHNFLIDNSSGYVDVIDSGPSKCLPSQKNLIHNQRNPQQIASAVREEYASYFMHEGELPWQNQYA